jgi:hypothetical protein
VATLGKNRFAIKTGLEAKDRVKDTRIEEAGD